MYELSSPPANGSDSLLKIDRHNGYSHTTPGNNYHFDKFTFFLEVLCHHYGGAISGKAHTNANNYSYKNKNKQYLSQ